jgi:hypothetical protein
MAAGVATPGPLIVTGPMAAPLEAAELPVPSSPAFALAPGALAGPRQAWTEPGIEAIAVAGVHAPEHDGQWFDRIHVIPRSVALGFVVADRGIEVEVWNAWRRGRNLTSIPVTGPDGVTGPVVSLPQQFAALQSRVHTVVVSVHGEPEIDNVVAWVFADLGSEGSDLTLTGWRLVAFSIPPDGIGTVQESLAYLTDLLEGWDCQEQRAQLREVPVYGLGYSFACLEARESQLLRGLLEGQGANLYAVPMWQYANRLEADVLAGATSLAVETDSVLYPDWTGQKLLLLWRDAHTCEVALVDTVGVGTVTLSKGTGLAWPAGTLVVPVVVGRLNGAPELARDSTRVRSGKVAFRSPGNGDA